MRTCCLWFNSIVAAGFAHYDVHDRWLFPVNVLIDHSDWLALWRIVANSAANALMYSSIGGRAGW